jgi:multiple sugar transport system substrate-binding protein
VANRMIERHGQPFAGARASHLVEGKWVGVPFYGRVEGYFLRGDKAREAGVDPATGFARWETAAESALKMSNPDQNHYGWGMTLNRSGDGEYMTWAFLHSWGAYLTDQTGQTVTLDSPQAVEAVTWLNSIYRDERFRRMLPPGVNAWNDTGNNEAYLAGQIGFTYNAGTLYAKAVLDKNPVAEQTLYIPKPLGPSGVRQQSSAGHYLYFMNGSPNYDPSVVLAEHLLSDAVQKELWRISQSYVVPANERRWEDPLIKDDRIASAFRPIAFAEPPFVGMAARGPITEAAEAVGGENVATDMMGEVLAGKSPAQAVKDAHARAVGIYQAFGFKGQ